MYKRQEADARAHEHIDIPDDLRTLFEEENRLAGDVTYFDIHKPMLVSARRR